VRDSTEESDVRHAVAEAVSSWGHLDTVIGCAGISGPFGARLAEVSVEDWDRTQAVNVRGNFLLAKHSVAHLQTSDVATIVYLASDSAFVAVEGMAPYCASRGALVMLTKALAVDYPILRVNALCPGIVDTPMSRADLSLEDGFADTGLPVMSATQIAAHAVFRVPGERADQRHDHRLRCGIPRPVSRRRSRLRLGRLGYAPTQYTWRGNGLVPAPPNAHWCICVHCWLIGGSEVSR
jgi:NAD(P)-dependent dehydrogenase (short-subunit alcohol dehydrogenase family)